MAEPRVVYRLPSLRCRTGLRARIAAKGFGVEACGFGSEGLRVGELVFSTSMTGYPESLTDPSYRGQILIYTHPMVGNYGVPQVPLLDGSVSLELESASVQVEGFIVAELPRHSHGRAWMSLDEWLRMSGVPGAYRVDTRALVKAVRDGGASEAVIAVYPEWEEPPSWESLYEALRSWGSYSEKDYTAGVSPEEPVTVKPPSRPRGRVSLLDCGVKHGIIRELLARGLEVVRMPCDSTAGELLEGVDGVVIGSGPGNPALLSRAASASGEAALSGKPALGVCLGMQLMALGVGASTYKLKYGHRGVNKPVVNLEDGRGYITTHNHGFAVDPSSLEGTGFKPWFISPDDGVLEGIKHEELPAMAVQFHPEGGPGPTDASWIFDLFLRLIEKRRS